MRARTFLLCLVIASFFAMPSAFAGGRHPANEDPDLGLNNRLWFFPGVDFGYSSLSTDVAGEEGKSGFGGGLRTMLGYYWPNWVADAGIGWFYKHIKGTRPTGFEGTLVTKTFFFQLDGRYRFSPAVSVGPFLAFHFGADVSHRPTIAPLVAEAEKGSMFLGGVEAVYDTRSGATPVRIGVRVGTDLDIPQRSLVEAQGFVQIGFPISPGPIDHHHHSEDEYFQLPLARVYFKTDSAELAESSLELLTKIGTFLSKNTQNFTKLEVEGHTDKQGGYAYNQDLSERRADRVMAAFTAAGVNRAVMMSRGFGYTKPLKESESVVEPKNRRVFIKVYGIGDRQSFKDELRSLTE